MSTPRSGNSWLRRMLATLYGLDPSEGTELWAHHFGDFPWERLPNRCVMQLHWRPAVPFRDLLADRGVRVVMVHRHPLDVLISILQLARHTSETGMWLLGEEGDETPIRGVTPRSEEFLRYATGPRAAALLSVSREWRQTPEILSVRYETLVSETVREFKSLTTALCPMPEDDLLGAVEACTMDRLRNPSNAPHFWKGKPGLWKRFFTVDEADRIASAHPDVFREFQYECDPDPTLSGEQADENWAAHV